MAGVLIYETPILPEWIDYNGHVRDAYYGLIASSACDALMDRIGLDAAYRARTHCTLYTLEMHQHFLNEVKSTERVSVAVTILSSDHKRIHAGFTLSTAAAKAATVEMMLLHVRQDEKPASVAFPPEVAAAIAQLAAAAPASAFGPPSRALALRPAARGA